MRDKIDMPTINIPIISELRDIMVDYDGVESDEIRKHAMTILLALVSDNDNILLT